MFTQLDLTLSCFLVSTTFISNWGELGRKLRSWEREIDGATDEEWETKEECPGVAEQDSTGSSSTTLEGELRRFETEDKPFL